MILRSHLIRSRVLRDALPFGPDRITPTGSTIRQFGTPDGRRILSSTPFGGTPFPKVGGSSKDWELNPVEEVYGTSQIPTCLLRR